MFINEIESSKNVLKECHVCVKETISIGTYPRKNSENRLLHK
jgi:hypothetical protein